MVTIQTSQVIADVDSKPLTTQVVTDLSTAKCWYIDVPLSSGFRVGGRVGHADCSIQTANNSSDDDSLHDVLFLSFGDDSCDLESSVADCSLHAL